MTVANEFAGRLPWSWTRPDGNASGSSFSQTYDTVSDTSIRSKMAYAPQHQPRRQAADLVLQTSGLGILWRGPNLRFRRHRRHRLRANWQEATSSHMLFACKPQSSKSSITIVTGYDRRIGNVRSGATHTNVESALSESILGLSGPLPEYLSVADCPCERSFIRLPGIGSLRVDSVLPEIRRGFKLLVKPLV